MAKQFLDSISLQMFNMANMRLSYALVQQVTINTSLVRVKTSTSRKPKPGLTLTSRVYVNTA